MDKKTRAISVADDRGITAKDARHTSNFHAGFLDHGERANAERCVSLSMERSRRGFSRSAVFVLCAHMHPPCFGEYRLRNPSQRVCCLVCCTARVATLIPYVDDDMVYVHLV